MSHKPMTAEERTAIVLEALQGKTPLKEILERHGISRSTYQRWRHQFLDAGKKALASQKADGADDRRQGNRVRIKVPCSLERNHSEKGHVILKLHTSDISPGGAYFETNRTLPAGEKVKMEILLPADKIKLDHLANVLVKVDGTILRSGPTGMAVIFDTDYKVYCMEP